MDDEIPDNMKQPMMASQGYPPTAVAPSNQVSNNVVDMGGQIDAARAWAILNASAGAPGNLGPGVPVMPIYEEIEPRWDQYNPGINLNILPRQGWGLTPFYQLRNIASACKEVRINIELIKRTIRGFAWEIAPVKDKKGFQAGELDTFFLKPDGVHDLKTWIELILEDLLSIDAVAVWPQMNGGKVRAFEVIAGDTIRINIDFRGRPSAPPAPAYFQVLWGMPRFWSTRDRLVYAMMHPRTVAPYGMTPIEWIIASINQAIRRDLQRIGYSTEGNVPHSFVGLPSDWNIDQIKEYQQYIDGLISGDEARVSKFVFIPHDGSNIPVVRFVNNDFEKVEFDEFLMKVACWAFGNSPTEFGLTGGRGLGGAGFMEGMEDVQYRTGIDPVVHFIQDFVTSLIHTWLKRPDAKFVVTGVEPKQDQLLQAQIDQLKISTGIYTAEFVQDRDGIDQNYRPNQEPVPAVSMETEPNAKVPESEELMRAARKGLLVELKNWQEMSERFIEKGWKVKENLSPVIPKSIKQNIENRLKFAKDKGEVKGIFDEVFSEVKADGGLHRVFGLRKAATAEPISMDKRKGMILSARQKAETRVFDHIMPLMRNQAKRFEIAMREKADMKGKADEPAPLNTDQEKWKRDFLTALLFALILSANDLGDIENDIYSTYGLPRIPINANEIISAYQDHTGYDLSRIAGDTIDNLNADIQAWENTNEPVDDFIARMEKKYFSEERANKIAVHETGNVLSQVLLEMMNAHGWNQWAFRHIGEDVPCSTPIDLDGRTWMGCQDLDGRIFDRSVKMPPDSTHDFCHCIGEPVMKLEEA